MPKVDAAPYRCGVCPKRRDSDVNHWFVLVPDVAQGKRQVLVTEWHAALADAEGAEYACGQEHAAVLISRWLINGSMEQVPYPMPPVQAKRLAPEQP